jgi:hypothetical protein
VVSGNETLDKMIGGRKSGNSARKLLTGREVERLTGYVADFRRACQKKIVAGFPFAAWLPQTIDRAIERLSSKQRLYRTS